MRKQYNLNNENFGLFSLDQYFEKSLSQEAEHDLEGAHFFFSIKGKGSYESLIENHIVNADELSAGIDLVQKGNKGILHFPEKTHKKSLSLFVKKEYLLKALSLNSDTEQIHEFFEKKIKIQNLKSKKINAQSMMLINQILTNPYADDLEKLLLEAKIIELLYSELKDLFNKEKEKVILSKQDKEAIHQAKELLYENLENPLSIKDLAKEVGINEFKLKYGFEKIYKNTPYNFSLENRLNEAKRLLEQSEYNINEIALKVGYKYAQSFSNAFYKKFAIRPKELMKTRDYYY